MINCFIFKEYNEIEVKEDEKYLFTAGEIKIDREFFIALDILLDKWELGLVYEDYNKTLKNIGTDDDRSKILKLVGDLRVPYYRADIFFIRGSKNTIKFYKYFTNTIKKYSDVRFAIVEALWKAKPLYLTLPNEIII